MGWSEWVVPGSCFAVEFTIVLFFLRRRMWRSFPIYLTCIVFILLRDLLLTTARPLSPNYSLIFWLSTPVEIVLTILAALESFWRVFRVFSLLRWFRFVLPGALVVALGYSAWQGYHFPPIEASPVIAALVNMTVTMNYEILAVVLLFFVLVAYLGVSWRVHEFRFILGFGVAALASSFGGTIRALFGGDLGFLSREAQPVGYLLALLIWLSAAVHPLPEEVVTSVPTAEQLRRNLEIAKNQLHNVRSFARKGRR